MCAALTKVVTDFDLQNEEKVVFTDEEVKDHKKREQWGGKIEFLLACIGNAVGLGNVWRFPYLTYKNGGGAFVIPYITMVFLIGLPLFLVELSLGQFSAFGPAHLYNELAPIFKGVGLASILATFVVSLYYNMIISWTLYYLFESFLGQKWQSCNNWFNDASCQTVIEAAKNNSGNENESAPEQFFDKYILGKSNGIEEIGTIKWQLALFFLLAWIIVIASLIKGIQSSGKVVYFTATFPYVILILLFIRGITLDGALDGIRYYVIPDWNKVANGQVWRDAAIQVFYSFGIAMGGMLTYASYNKFNNNIVRHTLLIGFTDMLTSLFAGFVVFAMVGFMAKTLGKGVGEVVEGGIGLAFIAIPDGLAQLPGSLIWCALYFFMLFLLGIDSQFAGIETITTYIFDSLRSKNEKKLNKPLIVSITGAVMYLIGLPLCTNGGIYVLEILDNYAAGFPYLVIALCEVLIVSYVYGLKRFYNDLNQMIEWRPRLLLKSHLAVLISSVGPFVIFSLLILDIKQLIDPTSPIKNGTYIYPKWSRIMGMVIACIPLLMIPLGAIHHLIFGKGATLKDRFLNGFKMTPKFRRNAELHLKYQEKGVSYQNLEIKGKGK